MDLILILQKFSNSPGLCSKKELVIAKKFLKNFNENLKIFVEAFGIDPNCSYVETMITKIDWYLNRLENQIEGSL